MTAMMDLKTRLRLAKTLAVVDLLDVGEQLARRCDELGTAGVAMLLVRAYPAPEQVDKYSPEQIRQALKIAYDNCGFDAIVGLLGEPQVAAFANCDTVVARQFPVLKPHEFGLRGVWVTDETALEPALVSHDVDYLIVNHELLPKTLQLSDPRRPENKPWFVFDADPRDIENGARRIGFDASSEHAKNTRDVKRLRETLNQAWQRDMAEVTFSAFTADPGQPRPPGRTTGWK